MYAQVLLNITLVEVFIFYCGLLLHADFAGCGSYLNVIVNVINNLMTSFIVPVQSLSLLGQFNTTPEFMLHPPKEHLVEKASLSILLSC